MKKAFLIFFILPLIYACGPKEGSTDAAILEAKQAVLDSMNQEILISKQQRQIDSLENETTYVSSKNHSSSANTYTPSERSSVPTTPVNYSSTKKKKMGNVAKGAIIGAGVGAITGAVVSKKKGKGAIIGGVLGAGAGAGVGAVINKKNQKKQQDGIVYF
jgi:outer membrane lipoprotein SlyB